MVLVHLGHLLEVDLSAGVSVAADGAREAAVDAVEGGAESGIDGAFYEAVQIGTPIAGQHGVGSGSLDLGDVGREILDLAEGYDQFVTHEFHVGRALLQQPARGGLEGLAIGIVLIHQVHLLDLRIAIDLSHQRGHLHVHVGVEAEVPERAQLVRERRRHRGVIQEHDLLTRVSLVVLVDELDDVERVIGTDPLNDVAQAHIHRFLELLGGLFRFHGIVEPDDLQFPAAQHAAPLVDLVGGMDVVIERFGSDRRDRPG